MIYDYKSEKTVQDVILECYCPLISDIVDEYSTLRRNDMLLIYAPSYITKEILGRILEEINGVWVSEDSRTELLYKDDNEVMITLTSDGMIYIDEARSDFGTLVGLEGASLTYIYDGFSKRDVDLLSFNGDSILIFGFEEEEIKGKDTLVEYSDNKDGDTHGFTASRSDENGYYSYSFYTSEKLDKNDIQKMLKDMGF
jgi:hypothetical protein